MNKTLVKKKTMQRENSSSAASADLVTRDPDDVLLGETRTSPETTAPGRVTLAQGMKQAFLGSRSSQLLSAVLVTQLLVAGGLYWQSRSGGEFASPESLVAVDAQSLDTIVIQSGESDDEGEERLVLKRVDNGWKLDDELGLPADHVKVDSILATLTELSPGLPVATTAAAQEQLEVSEEKFQRQITLSQGEQVIADLYLGTSPGFRKAHVRKVGETAIYAAKVNVFDLPADTDSWLDKQLLSLSDITSIQGEGFQIAKIDEQWQIREPAELAATQVVAEESVGKLVSTLQSLRATGVFAAEQEGDSEQQKESEQEPKQETSTLELQVAMADDQPLTLSMMREGDVVRAKRSDYSATFVVPERVFDELQALDRDALLIDKSVAGDGSDG